MKTTTTTRTARIALPVIRGKKLAKTKKMKRRLLITYPCLNLISSEVVMRGR
jgi:hypothetical protein